jgi:hypothetical protein
VICAATFDLPFREFVIGRVPLMGHQMVAGSAAIHHTLDNGEFGLPAGSYEYGVTSLGT